MTKARRLRSFVSMECEHDIGPETQKWRRYNRIESDKCNRLASVVIDGRYYCGQHGGQVALSLLCGEEVR